jgi:hypothetical protein
MKDLLTYTKLCDNCINKKCTGGYNCKYGSCLQKYLICYDDLNYNHCTDKNCEKIHLSKRNLKPILNKIYYTIDNDKGLIDCKSSEMMWNIIFINYNIKQFTQKRIDKLTNEYNLDFKEIKQIPLIPVQWLNFDENGNFTPPPKPEEVIKEYFNSSMKVVYEFLGRKK